MTGSGESDLVISRSVGFSADCWAVVVMVSVLSEVSGSKVVALLT